MESEKSMSYYILDRNNQIYGDYIKRLGDVLRNYQGNYEVTVTISTLQSLLTVLTESNLYKNKDVIDSFTYAEDIEKINILTRYISNQTILGLNKKLIIENTFHNKKTIKDILRDMRHALSHPVAAKNLEIPKTGFYTIQNEVIEKIIFVNSPDSEKFLNVFDKKNKQLKKDIGFPLNAYVKKDRRTYNVYVDNKIYRRYIKIAFTPIELKNLVLNLCDMFSDFIFNAETPENIIKLLAQKFAA